MISALPGLWRSRADQLRAFAPPAAVAFSECADALERALRTRDAELLTAAEASRLSGYSTRTLRTMARDGRLKDYGRPGSPRFKRSDLPRKGTR